MSRHDTTFTHAMPGGTRAALRVVPTAIDLHRCLTPLAHARPGDLVAMTSRHRGSPGHGPGGALLSATVCVMTERGLVATPCAGLSGLVRDKAEQAAGATLLFMDPLSRVMWDEDDGDGPAIHVMHFADAIVSAREDWLAPSPNRPMPNNPVQVQTALAPDFIAAHALRHRLCRYLTEFRLGLPCRLRQRAYWDLRIPEFPDLLTLEARRHVVGAPTRRR